MADLDHLTPNHEAGPLERKLESGIFLGRWLLAPFYIGLLSAIVLLLVKFFHELFEAIPAIFTMSESETVLVVLSLIDMALIANLMLMVAFVGYDHFVSRLGSDDKKDNPSWLRSTDYHGLKLKALGSIAVIAAIQLLRVFFDIHSYSEQQLVWKVVILVAVSVCGVLLAWMDRIAHPNHVPGHEKMGQ